MKPFSTNHLGPNRFTENRASILANSFLFSNKAILLLDFTSALMPIFWRVVFLVLMIIYVHTLPQNPNSSNDLVLNDEGTLDESNTFNEAGVIFNMTNPISNDENPDDLNLNESDASDRAYADIPNLEYSDIMIATGRPSDPKQSKSKLTPDRNSDPVPLPQSPPPPYYCENGRKAACCGQAFVNCMWWHKYRGTCADERRWTCCLKIVYHPPNWGVHCTTGYIPFETYAPNGDEVPAGQTTPAPHEPATAPERAPNAQCLPLPEYESPGNMCPVRGAKQLC